MHVSTWIFIIIIGKLKQYFVGVLVGGKLKKNMALARDTLSFQSIQKVLDFLGRVVKTLPFSIPQV